MTGGIKAIIFDLGNVLIDFDHRIAAKKISKLSGKSMDEIFMLFFDSPLTGLFEEGKISAQDFFLKVKEMLGLKITFEEFIPVWNGIFFLSEKNHAVYKMVQQLRDRYRILLLSNINILHFAYIKEQFLVFEPFHHVVTSFDLKMRKPDPEIYQKALALLGTKAEETFYTDDRPELVSAAKQLGIRGFVFEGKEQLKKDLLSVGVKVGLDAGK